MQSLETEYGLLANSWSGRKRREWTKLTTRPQKTASSAIPLTRWVLRTRPLRGQSRYYPNFLGYDAEEWWSFDHSSASSKDHSPKPKIDYESD